MGKDNYPRVELLNHSHAIAAFVSSEPAIAAFLTNKALLYQAAHACSVYLLLDVHDTVLGFFTLSNSAVYRESMSGEQAKKFRFNPIPAILIGQLARDIQQTKGGFGQTILALAYIEALKRQEWQLMCADPFSPESRDWFVKNHFKQSANSFPPPALNAPVKLPQLYRRRVDIEASMPPPGE